MNISEPFIRRPVMTILVMVSILMFGITAFKNLPISDLPNVDYPTIQVTVSFPGASPDTMANTCATPLEKEFMTIDGLNTITSNSITGQSTIILQFILDKSLDSASIDVQSAINRALPNLPPNLPYNPTYQKLNPAATPVLYLALSSDTMTQGDLYDYAYIFIAQRLSMIEGVSKIISHGSPYAARIQVDPEKLSAMKIGVNEVTQAIQQGNVDIPTGTLFGPKNEFTVDVNGQLMNAAGYNELSIKNKDGAIVKIRQIGRALDSMEQDKIYVHYFSKPIEKTCVVISVQRLPGANTINIINAINKLLPEIKKGLPASLEFYTIFDKSVSIKEAVHDVEFTLSIALLLVVTVIYLFLGKLFDTITPALAIPMSIVGTFVVMYFFNFSIDILSLMALTLCIGFLVDDAIVVLENNVRHVQMGSTPIEGTIKGSKEIGITILSMTLCLASVFIPMLFLGGVVGRLFREFAVTIIISVIISGFISLTLTPLLCSRFIPPLEKLSKKGIMEKFSDLYNEKLLETYKRGLNFIMHHKPIILLLGLFCLLGSFFLLVILPKDFLPNDDIGAIQGYTRSRDGTSPFEMAKLQQKVSETIMKDESLDHMISVASISNDNEGLMFLNLKPFKQRDSIDTIISRLMTNLDQIPGINSYLYILPLINLQVGTQSKGLYQYTLTSIDQPTLNKYTNLLEQKLKETPGFLQVTSDLEISQPQLTLDIDRDRASNLDISAADIENLLSYAYSGGKISTINSPTNQYEVIIETLPSYYKNPETLNKLFIRSTTGNLIPITEVVKATQTVGPLSINHTDGLPSATITFNLGKLALGDAVQKLQEISQDTLPSSISAKVVGTADVFKTAFQNLSFLFLITIFVIYIILGILYESFIHPITVMSALPPATFGGLLTLYVFHQTLSLYSFVGLIMLIGIVLKNGIMMVDFANEKILKEQKSASDAIFEACLIRFRPIMMTTIAALFGALPIALGVGGSTAQTRIPLGLVVVGGLIISQILTLFLIPVIYYYMELVQEKIKKIFRKKITA